MKITTLMTVIAASLALNLYADTPPPSSVAADTTAGVSLERLAPRAVPNALTTGARIKITPMLLPDKASPSWAPATAKVVADALAGTVPTMAHAITDPKDYTICPDGHIDWFNLVDSQNTPLWQAQLNPASPFDQERGQEHWDLVEAWSKTGINDVSMDAITAVFASNDGNVLGSTVNFNGTTYTPLAVVQLEDGTVISSGPASQQGQHVIVLVHSKVFTGGDTQSGLDQVRNWITPRNPYNVTNTVSVGSDSAQAVVTTAPPAAVHLPYTLKIVPGDTSVQISVDNPEPNGVYQIWGRPEAETGSWYLDGTITIANTNMLIYPNTVGMSRFFKAQHQ